MAGAHAGRRTGAPDTELPETNPRHVSPGIGPRAERHRRGDPATLQQDDGQWVMPAKNYASTRFSGLDEINVQNVSRLGVSWTFSTGMVAGHEAAPLVVGSTMFIVTPFPNIVYAFDLSSPGAPIKWQYDPKPPGAAKGVACCDLVNRGAAYADGHDLLQHARRPDDRARRRDRTAQMDHPTRRYQQGRDDDDGAAGRQGEGPRRQQRRRVRRPRMAHRARRRVRRGRLARLQHRSRQGRVDRSRLQAVLSVRSRHRPRDHDVARRGLAHRRRDGVGLDFLRP